MDAFSFSLFSRGCADDLGIHSVQILKHLRSQKFRVESIPKKKLQLIIEESDEESEVKSDNSMINLVLESDTEVSNEICLPYEKQEPYLENFLKSITNKNGTYKRVCISPLRYAGGKTKAIGLILENLPKLKEKKIVSPFFGGGSVELCLSQMLDIKVIGYDIFNMLANFWNVLINNKDEFI